MNINVYLPDDIAKRAKSEELPLSRMLRDAVTEELERRDAMSATLRKTQAYELDLEDEDGGIYTGRITGMMIAEDGDIAVYLTEDKRLIVYDGGNLRYSVLGQHPPATIEEELREWLRADEAYKEAIAALGLKMVIDL